MQMICAISDWNEFAGKGRETAGSRMDYGHLFAGGSPFKAVSSRCRQRLALH